jgi:lipopolysaccharide biosynthesis glycosyltransferase
MIVFTSITLNYLPKARVLAKTLKRMNPNREFHVFISDLLLEEEKESFIQGNASLFDRIYWLDDLEVENKKAWIFKHTVVELCTAVKGLYLRHLINQDHKKIVYIDPDIAIFNDLSPIESLLDEYAILLAPHLLDFSDESQAILDNEIGGTMRHGVFNLGFLAINAQKSDGQRFAKWWSSRLYEYCYADYERGLFTDQKWCDLVPAFFEDYYIIRDPGYDVASWNLNKRKLSFSKDGQILVNEKYPLRFYHFTGYDSGIGRLMTQRYGTQCSVVEEVWAWYLREVTKMGQNEWQIHLCHFDFYKDGKEILPRERKLYRNREDLQSTYKDPYAIGKKLRRYARRKESRV